MNKKPRPTDLLRELLHGQLLGVLGTQYRGAPYTSLVAFVAIDNLKALLFATSRSTRKFRNLQVEPQASMLIDNRDNTPGDFADAVAATAVGTCVELHGDKREEMSGHLIDRHPQLAAFVASPSCALMELEVNAYMLVSRFQHVTEIRPVR